MTARAVDVVVLSDLHLGTPSARAEQCLSYLKQIRPKRLVIAGDFCDLGHYWRNHWPAAHLHVVRRILKMAARGTEVYYVVGNHDAPMRRMKQLSFGDIHIMNRLELTYGNGKRALVVHGDCFDGAVSVPGWVKAIGGWLYEVVMRGNNFVNRLRRWVGLKPVSLATVIKNNIGAARTYISRYKDSCVEHARELGYDAIISGHIHQPANEMIDGVHYLNSGDWVEHCTALEYQDGAWDVVTHVEPHAAAEDDMDRDLDQGFEDVMAAFPGLVVAA